MKKIRDVIIKGNMLLGSVVTILAILDFDLASADTITITIDDPSETEKVDDATMTELNDHTYRYEFQTLTTYDDGEWFCTITITSGGKTIVRQDFWKLYDQE